jgi:predicted nucleic acid-binding protein
LSRGLIRPLDESEATCVAQARSRGYTFFTDDRVARREARRWGVPLSGTIGALVSLIDEGHKSREEADSALQGMIVVHYHSPVRAFTELL